MEIENTLAKNITISEDKASYDACCKRLLANKVILAWIMKSCLEEYRDIDVNEIAEKYIEGNPQVAQVVVNPDEKVEDDGEQIRGASTEDSTINEGTIFYDIRFYALVPVSGEFIRLIINVEAQNDFYPGYPIIKRGIYYCSRMISAQYGTEFTEVHYEKIKKVYSIWICLGPPKKRQNTITRYSIKEENVVGHVTERKENYDLLTTIMICLGEAQDDNYGGILKLLDVLLSSEKQAEEKKKILEEDFKIEMTKTLESEVSMMCNLSKGVEEKGIQKGIQLGMQQGIQQGIQQGMQQGMQKGRQEGIQQGILSSIKSLMDSMGWTAEQAMKALKVPEAEQVGYVNMLKK